MGLFANDKIVNAREFSIKKCKATIQRTGRMGFSSTAALLMKLTQGSYLLLSECGDGNLAVVVVPDNTDGRGFPLHMAMAYFTVDLKGFFDLRGIDYRQPETTVIYDIVKTDEVYQNCPVFKLTQRVKKRRIKAGCGGSNSKETAELTGD